MFLEEESYTYVAVDGIRNSMEALQDIADGKMKNCFVEMSACAGSCVGGPVMKHSRNTPIQNYIAIDRFAGKEDFQTEALPADQMAKEITFHGDDERLPDEVSIQEILKKMGKNSVEDELNCGSCGYNTCRDKAVAVYQGKANFTMCLPFLKDRAESFSDTIISNTPNGILVVNESLEVQQINEAALKLMNIKSRSLVMGEPIIRILDPVAFVDVLDTKKNLHGKKAYLAEYGKYVEQSILYDESYHILICIMRDVTEKEAAREMKEEMSRNTIETANRVVEKQMRVVQEIASLLGETTAETRIALTRLKESFEDE